MLMSRPGLLHPPAGRGDGLLERDIWKPGVPVPWRVNGLAGRHGRRAAGGWLRLEMGLWYGTQHIPGIGESWLGFCRWTPSDPSDEAVSPPKDILRPLEADERLRWCEGADLSSAEEEVAEDLGGARLTV